MSDHDGVEQVFTMVWRAQGIEYQHNFSGLKISIVVMLAASNDVDDLRPLLPGVEQALASSRTGEIFLVGG